MGFIADLKSITRNPAIPNDGDGSSLTSPENTTYTTDSDGNVSFPGIKLTIECSDVIDYSIFLPLSNPVLTFFGPDSSGLYPNDPLYTPNPVYEIPLPFLNYDYQKVDDPLIPPTFVWATGVGVLTSTQSSEVFFPSPTILTKGWLKITVTQTFTKADGTQTVVTKDHWYAVSEYP